MLGGVGTGVSNEDARNDSADWAIANHASIPKLGATSMAWVRLDDHVDEHPKIAALSDGAFRLWTNALCYANRSLTDGFIPANMLGRMHSSGKVKTLAAELVRQGLWSIVDGGWRIHDYLVYQPSKADVESIRLVRAEAGRQGGLKRSANRQEEAAKQSASKVLANSQAKSNPVPVPGPGAVPGSGEGESATPKNPPSETGGHRPRRSSGAVLTLPSQSSDSVSGSYWTTLRQAQFQKTCRLFAAAMGGESYPSRPELQSVAEREWQVLIGDKADGKPADCFAYDIQKAAREGRINGFPPEDFKRILAPVLRKG